MRHYNLIAAALSAGLIGLGAAGAQFPASAAAPAAAPHTATAPESQKAELRSAMRKLWEDHITFTRNYIISDLSGLADAKAVADRLMKNQEDIGNAVKPFYGNDAGTKLTALLKDHIAIATDVVKQAKAGDKAKLTAAQQKWSDNGKEIAAFLSGANPNWDKAALERMLQQHLDFTTGEVTNRLAKNWAADIKAYDDGHQHMLMFADALTDGIAKQFPNRFTS
jgi:hypothetical protein